MKKSKEQIEINKLRSEIDILKNILKYKDLKKILYKIRIIGWTPYFDKMLKESTILDFEKIYSVIDYFDSFKYDNKYFNIIDLEYKTHKFPYDDGFSGIYKIFVNGILEKGGS